MTALLIVISTFWAFAGLTSVHGIFQRMLHTFIVPDLLLVALLAAIVVMPLGQFAVGPPGQPRALPAPHVAGELCPPGPPRQPNSSVGQVGCGHHA